ncbi:LysR family transcriptional regulator [Actinoplanes sichuanensis]|uniref:LysR family transcriptional regulator n=1 Tax=Actinoplanes sichuanensis TaxID=512349 RepID=A0ABW4AGA5_9ACTN|nr:LysR family transcriptional regulator [Actinoplanes sichuanensis]BEL11909.1 LysR family transcriptional regulator [Actinoplanes sichuanensis]
MLDVTRLTVLAAVARHGSVTAAARALHYAQPSVSHHLARLEAETGSRLLQRVGRGVRLTEAGRLLAERAEEILGRIAAAEVELAELTGLRAGRVRLAAFPSALGTFVPVAAAGFTTAHPGVDLRFTEAEPPAAIRLLRGGEVDVALVFAHPGESVPDLAAPDPGGVRSETLLEEPSYLVVPAGWAGDRLADHRDRPWIGGCERCRSRLVAACAAEGFVPDIRFTTDDYVAVQALVAAGMGATTLPALALAAHRDPRVRAVRLPGPGRRVSVAVLGEPPDPPATSALLDQIRAAAPAIVR